MNKKVEYTGVSKERFLLFMGKYSWVISGLVSVFCVATAIAAALKGHSWWALTSGFLSGANAEVAVWSPLVFKYRKLTSEMLDLLQEISSSTPMMSPYQVAKPEEI